MFHTAFEWPMTSSSIQSKLYIVGLSNYGDFIDLIAGGRERPQIACPLNDVFVFDTTDYARFLIHWIPLKLQSFSSLTFDVIGSEPVGRWRHSATVIRGGPLDGEILLFGGRSCIADNYFTLTLICRWFENRPICCSRWYCSHEYREEDH